MNKPRPIHQFLFPLFPVLSFFNINISSLQAYATDTAFIAALCVGGAACGFFLLSALLKSSQKAALITSVAAALFFSYGHLTSFLSASLGIPQFEIGKIVIGNNKLFYPLFILSFIAASALALRLKYSLSGITRVLNFTALCLIAVSLFNSAMNINMSAGKHFLRNKNGNFMPDAKSPRPDIYYILLDGYASNRTLLDYGFDNSSFVSQLEKRGFKTLANPRSNYIETILSLTSSLNMDYPHNPNRDMHTQEAALQNMLENNRLQSIMRKNGYRYLHLGSRYALTYHNRNAEKNYYCGNGTELRSVFLETTMLKYFSTGRYRQDKRKHAQCQFKTLRHLPAESGPKFVFAHIEILHPPYVFGPKGEPYLQKARGWGGKKEYVNQIKYMNSVIIPIIDRILSESETQPVIIIQSDHGPGLVPKNSAEMDRETIVRKASIFASFLIPGDASAALPEGMTPVNYFRYIFNNCFGAKLKYLPERTYFFDYREGVFKDLTARIIPAKAR